MSFWDILGHAPKKYFANLRLVSIRRRLQAWRKKFFLSLFSLMGGAAPRIKLNRETKNVSRYACNLRLMETSLYTQIHAILVLSGTTDKAIFL